MRPAACLACRQGLPFPMALFICTASLLCFLSHGAVHMYCLFYCLRSPCTLVVCPVLLLQATPDQLPVCRHSEGSKRFE